MTNYLNLCKALFSLGFITDNTENLFNGVKLDRKTVLIWYDRSRQRARLGKLDAYMLKDIGLTREQVEIEVGKYFWQS